MAGDGVKGDEPSGLSGAVRPHDLAWAAVYLFLLLLLLVHNFGSVDGSSPLARLVPFRVQPFGFFMALNIFFGWYAVRRWCQTFDLDWSTLSRGLVWIIFLGLYVSHWVSVAFYHPGDLSDPWAWLDLRKRISSFGGIYGGSVLAWLYLRHKKLPPWPYFDALAWAFVGGYVFGRAGCFSIHDHPGRATDFFLGVEINGIVRHDLGFYEMGLMLSLFLLATVMSRTGKPAEGAVVALCATLYAPVRFFFDSLRIEDPRYATLTPGQWFCLPTFAIGLWAFHHVRSRRP